MNFTESIVEDAALAWLGELGFAVLHGPEIAPGELAAERTDFGEGLLPKRLRAALRKLNPTLPTEALDEAFRKVTVPQHPSLIANNRAFHRMLVDGIVVECRRKDDSIGAEIVRLIDFDDSEANDWLVVNQFTVIEGQHNRRPDVVLFVNGLPLGVIELKNAADEQADIWAAFNQLQTYKQQVPSLFIHNAVLVISDGLETRIGTISADKERFMPWRTIEGETVAPASMPQLEVLLRGVFDKRRFLDLVRHFIVFEDDGGTSVIKKMAGYHQFHAVRTAIEETLRACGAASGDELKDKSGGYFARPQAGGEVGDRRVGVVWHTQGSGKSLTMAFYAGRLVLEPAMENPTLVLLTDRNDLDDQLFGTFSRCYELLRQKPVQAESREHLRDLLKVASGGVIFTTIHKFFPDEKGGKHPPLSDRRNIVVIADEAHRSQYDFIDGFARHMRDALPNASFIGFTGTPIEKSDANTRSVFGDYISIYDIQRAVEDKATVPIYYEGRLAKLELKPEERPKIDPNFEEATEGEELDHKEKLKTKWAALEAVVGAEKRLGLIAKDFVKHWDARLEAMDGKAMIVCMSRRICYELYEAIRKLRPDWNHKDDDKGVIKIVMTGSASDPLAWQDHIRNKPRREALAKRFKNPQDPLKIVLVRDMWLTGFDAPSLHTMYADKPMRSQATAGLRRAIELEMILQSWRERLGADPTRLEVVRIQRHRQWAAIARGLSPAMGDWLATTDTTSRCETLLGIESKLAALNKAIQETHDSLGFFGRVWGDGPFAILSTSGTPRDVEQHCGAFTAKIPLLPNYAAFLREQEAAKKLGLTNLVKHAENAQVSTSVLIDTFRGAVAYQQARAVWESDDELRYFQSNEHERLRQKFQDDDEKQLKTNRKFIRTRVGNGDVTEGWKGKTAGEHTEFALLQHEISKQRRHLPIRKLVHRAGRAMQDLCPCWMMTPLAVAQFLAPGAISFDLVIMDEASQINPEDAWGAIARGVQLIVVGDQKQMPPSDFFESALEEDETPEEEEDIDGGKSESILDASVASLLSSSLLWHYRSRHEKLIAPANCFSYDNRLILFPQADRSNPELGVRYQHIADATTTIGKVTNALEANAVAQRVRELVLREYAKLPKDRLTIGVVTMNLSQQDCVMDLLEKMRQDDRRFDLAMVTLTAEQNEEPLFVRNLENIQGDERDIMVLSCTYGPHTPGGTPTQRFGPLNRDGGERRFNVLITRAKWRMEVFASIRSDQIIVDGKRQGVRDFHLFLKYAESGILVDRGESTGKQSDSPFEVQVEAVLRRAGFETERQVGVAGYFIDLAVKHPHHTGLFALGIECDGKTYHSSRAARDRDRLREKVLMERGWKLHRIWSTDWFVNPKQAKKRLLEAVDTACR